VVIDMIKVNYNAIPNELFINYLEFLINQLYKSLCLKEEKSDTLFSYLMSLRNELMGSVELIEFLKFDARYCAMLNKIQYLVYEPNVSQNEFKKEIFSCINIVQKLIEKYKNKI
jgi:hypothetical protein